MRIGLVYHQFVLRGGLEGYLLDFASRLQTAGHDLKIVTADIDPALAKKLDASVVKVPVVKGAPLVRMWQFDRATAQMSRKSLDVDVMLGFGRTTTQDIHRAGGGCHRVYSRLLPPWKRWGAKNLLELQLEKKLYTTDRTRFFVVNSSQVRAQIQAHYGTPKDRFRVIHTAVDTDRFRPHEDRQRLKALICQELNSDPARPAFLFVSLSHRRKGLDALLRAWKEVDADLWIVGKPLGIAHQAMISDPVMSKKVFRMDARSDVNLLYQSADWFIHPTMYDACANTVLQSMACGLPGLISIYDGATDLLRDGQNGFLLPRPQEEGDLLRVIQKALDMPEEDRQRLGAAARSTVQPLTWQAHLEKWHAVIQELGD